MNKRAQSSDWKPTPLGYAILGLLAARPRTGYEIGKLFEGTPMAVYSSSPGSIYPVLKRLRDERFAEQAPHPDSPKSSKLAFAITDRGTKAFLAWLKQPMTRQDVERNMQEAMLRFAFMSGNVTDAEIVRFLRTLREEVLAYLDDLSAYAEAAMPHMPLSGALALQSGIDSHRDTARWAEKALEAFSAKDGARENRRMGGTT